MEKITRREFIKKTSITVANVSLIAETAEIGLTNGTDAKTIKEKKA